MPHNGILASVAIAALVGAISSGSCPAAEQTAPLDPRVSTIVNGIRQERQAVRSGACRVRGRVSIPNWGDERYSIEGEELLYIAFDEHGSVRSDRREPEIFQDADADTTRKGVIVTKSARTKNSFTYWIDGDEYVHIWPANRKASRQGLRVLNLQTLGMASYVCESNRLSFEKVISQLCNPVSPTVDETNPDEVLLLWQHPNRSMTPERRVWIRPREGFTPVRTELRGKFPDGQWFVFETTETRWKKMNDVWVPVENTMVTHSTGRTLTYSRNYSLKWEKVNEPIDSAEFDFRSFGVPEWVGILDGTLGEPLIVKASGGVPPPAKVSLQIKAMIGYLIGIAVIAVAAAIWWQLRKGRAVRAG